MHNNGLHLASGMDLRTHIASKALAGLLANGPLMADMAKSATSDKSVTMTGFAVIAVRAADCLIAELNKEKR